MSASGVRSLGQLKGILRDEIGRVDAIARTEGTVSVVIPPPLTTSTSASAAVASGTTPTSSTSSSASASAPTSTSASTSTATSTSTTSSTSATSSSVTTNIPPVAEELKVAAKQLRDSSTQFVMAVKGPALMMGGGVPVIDADAIAAIKQFAECCNVLCRAFEASYCLLCTPVANTLRNLVKKTLVSAVQLTTEIEGAGSKSISTHMGTLWNCCSAIAEFQFNNTEAVSIEIEKWIPSIKDAIEELNAALADPDEDFADLQQQLADLHVTVPEDAEEDDEDSEEEDEATGGFSTEEAELVPHVVALVKMAVVLIRNLATVTRKSTSSAHNWMEQCIQSASEAAKQVDELCLATYPPQRKDPLSLHTKHLFDAEVSLLSLAMHPDVTVTETEQQLFSMYRVKLDTLYATIQGQLLSRRR
ncbi:Grap2 and cyclin-D-interacting [Pelomyxa schiedti]|nr:Grap2 and cyclin-D-interacting [Pelomyxa schiedti]